jgi:segregation and condensation protein A
MGIRLSDVRDPAMSQYQIKLEVFEGPFDLLLHLINKHQVDIYDIPIAKIADEFVEYLESAEFVDVEQAADFLVMAATLMQIKARMLVPRPAPEAEGDEPEDPRSELVLRLLEYSSMKQAASLLEERSEFWSHIFTREVDEVIPRSQEHVPDLGGVSASELARAFLAVLARAADAETDDSPAVISKERCTVAGEMLRIRRRLRYEYTVSFFSLFEPNSSKELIVTTFLALLELIKLGLVVAEQAVAFSDILLREGGQPGDH